MLESEADNPFDHGSVRGPRVSVIMPVYNAERYLEKAARSILDQSFADIELIAIDDGSTDSSPAILERLAVDPRLRVISNPRNLGIVKTRNRGLAAVHSAAEFVAMMDSDDISLPHRIAAQIRHFELHPNCALVGSHNFIIDETDRVIGRRTYPIDYDSICRVITRYNPIAQPVAMIRRSVLRQVGDYDERYPRCQDYDLWCRIAEHHPIANVDDFLLQYRISASQGKTTHLKESLRLTLTIQRHYLFHPRFMNPLNVAAWLAQATLLRLPDALVMRAFKALRYRKV